ncbi:MAG: 2-succinyl-5-enolpyruvyl-6-hydroxy-3-cyclohexene-1-carboxylic-acid synthase [Candidatus Marinimicrobia bacterium]|nr:2-succinyl-5-enolpyruvyl-6-hydroxy-3-cyclohexene-1-carboxylic-acid synthase [Candidatus Neomarinimicrobiota bacterium]MBT3501659.1 2-succinyl-5-enolpyruvyl-6-hydroxy-3-cyclohexene-1-carboxylic-acid synthase [Candidatus Neomarinimicrobiota bacterium]MBT3839837.1 2-succinyl-5-enolpyruvyl-6-hydroxy-3-cyclohexene-1-carboxylic-acid synthase [Candidatus Neomarinimicrobiota bacterium]MBT3998425.1 2-succinyl-5-enolpyruvyl-6-hydroxy-3-cyclohexene-1-carboxylic-acid synthase [Candidatus Neomarinimicrobi
MSTIALQNTQHIYDLVNLCAEFGVEKAVVCPGSRCAPLLIGFGKHPDIETISITDERSAGFVGLGIAQQTNKPVVLVCTSGTAAQNFIPAVTEAFYQQVPLIVLTADRPPEWIGQWDGQTIHQKNLYAPHIKNSVTFQKNGIDLAIETLCDGIESPAGPIHINIPIDEPFYPESMGEVVFAAETQREQRSIINEINELVWDEFVSILESSKKVMVLGGQSVSNHELKTLLNQLEIPIVGGVISNLHGLNSVIKSPDLIFTIEDDSLAPDALITFGRSIISKNLKLYLRKHKPKHHWHIGLGMVGNPFKSLTKIIETQPLYFFKEWSNKIITKGTKNNKYLTLLSDAQKKVDEDFDLKINNRDFNYFGAVQKVIQNLPENSVLHLGNSMPVRIANFIGIEDSTIDVWSNRGTSGIDGVVSTAVGHALAEPSRKHTLILGDLSFFYDRNGLWLNHEFPTNLQIVILNDSGGGIFSMIPGPSNQGGLSTLFTTPHERTAELTALEFGLAYSTASSLEEIHYWESGILEIFTDMKINKKVFNQLATKAPRLKENI